MDENVIIRLWMAEGYPTVNPWHAWHGFADEDLGFYEVVQLKSSDYLFKGVEADYTVDPYVVCPWAVSVKTAERVRCKVVKNRGRYRLVTIYGEPVAILKQYKHDEFSLDDTVENEWMGEGWYSVSYSDGGQDYTNDGPVWLEYESELCNLLSDANINRTETHIAYAVYLGSADEPDMD